MQGESAGRDRRHRRGKDIGRNHCAAPGRQPGESAQQQAEDEQD